MPFARPSAGVAAVPSLIPRLRITATVATGYNTLMTTRAYLDEAMVAADAGGKFDPHPLARQFKMTKFQQRAVGADLERMKLVTVTGGNWQLLGVAREMAFALHGQNVDRSSRLGSSSSRSIAPKVEPKSWNDYSSLDEIEHGSNLLGVRPL